MLTFMSRILFLQTWPEYCKLHQIMSFYDQFEHKLNISAFRNLAEVLRLSAKMLAYYAC